MLLQALEKQYICPGETRPISRAVHLSRLASYFPACRDCPCRTDAGSLLKVRAERAPGPEAESKIVQPIAPLTLPSPPVEPRGKGCDTAAKPSAPGRRRPLFTGEGVRGVWHNELTRAGAAGIAEAFASLLWETSSIGGSEQTALRSVDRSGANVAAAAVRTAQPVVVVGHDERPASPDIVTGAAAALRRMGCQVIDVGQATPPCVRFAVHHLDAAGGLHVTGAGCPPSWTGIDFVLRGGAPVSACARPETSDGPAPPGRTGFTLADVAARVGQPCGRPSREAPPQRTFHAGVPYEAGLLRHFHALRPLTVCCGCPVRLVRETLERLFSGLPCRLRLADIPRRSRDLSDPRDADAVRMGDAVRQTGADVGVLIDDDAQRCGFFDERGRLVPAAVMTQLLAGLLLDEHPRGTVVASPAAADALRPAVERRSGCLVVADAAPQALSEAMRLHGAVLGSSLDGRTWLKESFPTCDAVTTLARALDLLSRGDRPLSELVECASVAW